MRLFIAVPLSQAMCDSLTACQKDLHAAGVRANYSPEENLHLTLAFIGEYPDQDAVLDALSRVSFSPVSLALDGIGSFGELWWAGISGGCELEALTGRVRHALSEAGIPFDRKKFRPHITLLRRAGAQKIPPVRIKAASMTAERIVLYRSDRGKRGMLYTELGSIDAEQTGAGSKR